MKRVVIDTNIWIRILLAGPITPPILEAWQTGKFRVVFSQLLLDELEEVSRRPRLRKRIPHERALKLLRPEASDNGILNSSSAQRT
jgi:putative PIN family toxin of toxin-antitoxin system